VRVELWDGCGRTYIIETLDPGLVGRWFAEWAPRLVTADSRMETRIRLWPTDQAEMTQLGLNRQQEYRLDQDGLLLLAQEILDASKRAGELVESRRRNPVPPPRRAP
jgi:hypothetical protein